MAALRVYLIGAFVAAMALAVVDVAQPDSRAEPQRHSVAEGPSVTTSQPTVVSLRKGSSLGTPAVVSDPVVGTVAVWPRGPTLEHRVMPVGGVWQPRAAFPRGRVRGQSDSVSVTSDGHGRITAAWVVRTGLGTSWLVTARRLPNGEWSTPKVMDEFVSRYEWNAISTPSLVMGGDGSTVLSWVVDLTDPSDEGSESSSRLHAAYRPPEGHWRPVHLPSIQDGGSVADVDDNGAAVLVTYKDRAQRLMRCDSATCVKGKRLPEDWPLGSGIVDAALSPDGTTTSVLLSKMVRQGGGSVIFAAHRENGAWSVPVRVSPPAQEDTYYDTPGHVMNDHTATILVGGRGACTCLLHVITRAEGEDYGAPLSIAEGGSLTPLGLWANDDGAAMAVWERYLDLEAASSVSYRSGDDGPWSVPTDLPPEAAGVVPVGTVHPGGGGMVLWYDGKRISAWSWPPSVS
ncbi:hypothetical protein IEZ26_02325 [Nocardioides cavernae]|uniref:Exo-alpha-sialidase n=1 Tax=Nocardioides cavernae TaxID=1921566 RepID=A0ABR8N9A3_9ACTN|nr:hypothetical protein [Nocardioides cavernae]MBD3923444.1 hypothetical protein [Nocardioides cavernae]MBM7511632.1 hypothetical protein [Nocardioides cavernae]